MDVTKTSAYSKAFTSATLRLQSNEKLLWMIAAEFAHPDYDPTFVYPRVLNDFAEKYITKRFEYWFGTLVPEDDESEEYYEMAMEITHSFKQQLLEYASKYMELELSRLEEKNRKRRAQLSVSEAHANTFRLAVERLAP